MEIIKRLLGICIMSRKLYRECYIPGVLVVLLMLVVSFFIRVGDFEKSSARTEYGGQLSCDFDHERT